MCCCLLQLFFDEDCRTEEGTAYIRIYKDERKVVLWGENMYHGRDKDANCESNFFTRTMWHCAEKIVISDLVQPKRRLKAGKT